MNVVFNVIMVYSAMVREHQKGHTGLRKGALIANSPKSHYDA